jgi:predicted transcriptional regulator
MAARKPLQPLGELEQLVMDIVWQSFPLTARQVCDRMTGRSTRAYTTVMTTLDRLHRKGVLRRDKEGLAWRYEPVLSKQAFERALADQLASGILQSHGEAALAAFVDAAAEVDASLLDRLRKLIDVRRKRRG